MQCSSSSKKVFFKGLLHLMCIGFVFSCNDPSSINFDPNFIQKIDSSGSSVYDTTIYLDVYDTLMEKSNATLKISPSTHLAPVGYLKTPEFGTIKSQVFLQLKPSSFPLSFPTAISNIRLDSVYLSLKYTTTEGDTLAQNSFDVYPVSDDKFIAGIDKNFHYGNNIVYDNSTRIGSFRNSAYNATKDTFSDYVTTHVGVLRFALDTAWSRRFIEQDNTSGYSTDSAFNSFFKGITLSPNESTQSSIIHLNLIDTSTRLIIYYHYNDTSMGSVLFRVTSSCNFATEVVRDVSGSLAEQAIQNLSDNSQLYLQQPPNGSAIMIKMPDLSTLTQRGYIVHKAEILMEEKPLPSSSSLLLNRPQQLYIDMIRSGESFRRPIPYALVPIGYSYDFFPSTSFTLSTLQGYYQKSDTYQGYKLDITRYMQGYFIGTQLPAIDFKVWSPYRIDYNVSNTQRASSTITNNSLLATSGVLLYGKEAGNKKSIRLRILYSKP